MKKKLIACMGMLGLALSSVLLSPIQSDAATSAEQATARTVTDADIGNYIAGKNAPGKLFYPYDVVVNKTVSWTEQNYYVKYSEDAMGEAYFDSEDTDYYIPNSLTFEKGYVYFVNAALVARNVAAQDIANNRAQWNHESTFEFTKLYTPDIKEIFDTSKASPLKDKGTFNWLGCDADAYYENEFSYTWDNTEVCSLIDSKWRSKLNEFFSSSFTKKFLPNGEMIFIVPKDTFTITRSSTSLTYGLEAYIHKGKLMDGDYFPPEIGGTVNLSVNVDNQPSMEEILSHVKAIDETDGVVPVTVTSSTYTPGEMKIGEFYINLSATDAAGNTGTETIIVNRFDSTSPSIEGQELYNLNYTHDITLQKILDNLITSDNVDTNLPIEVVSDTFTGNEHVLGSYSVVVRTKDLSNNYSANKTIAVNVRNEGHSVITAPKEITVTISQPLTLEQLKERISVVDGYDGEIENYTIEGFEAYTNTSATVGYNKVTISYTNSGNNTATAEITIKKVDDKAPGIYFDSGYFVMLPQGVEFTLDQFKTQAARVLKIQVDEILAVEGEYDVNTAGEYIMTLSLADETQEKFTILVGDIKPTVPGFQIKDLFTSFFWMNSWNSCMANLWNYSKWNWLNWTFVVTGFGIALAVLGGVVFKKKKNG